MNLRENLRDQREKPFPRITQIFAENGTKYTILKTN